LDLAYYFDAYVVNIDGSNPHSILTGVTDRRSPSWAPDGKSVIVGWRPGPLNDRSKALVLWSVPTDGSFAHQLTFNTSDAIVPRWSPDGRTLSYSITHGLAPNCT
jgi:Tol biopolymer transport system component